MEPIKDSNNETTIFVVSHKPFKNKKIDDALYKTIWVGNNPQQKEGDFIDSEGDNISKKNSNYCELTALYWLWKNYHSIKNVGFCHYRRYLSLPQFFFFRRQLTKSRINKLLNKYDILLPKKYFWKNTVKAAYDKGDGFEKDLITTREIISKIYPDYVKSFDEVTNSNNASYRNMLITSKVNLDNYCEWLFNILFNLEKLTDLSSYSVAEKRIFGYVSEILLNVWVHKNGLKVFYLLEESTEVNFYNRIRFKLSQYRNRIVYKLKKGSSCTSVDKISK